MTTINVTQMKEFFIECGESFKRNLEYLSELDSALGDGDHGVSMAKGFNGVKELVGSKEFDDIGSMWMEAGKLMMKDIGGTCGPLFATIFIKGGMAAKGLREIGAEQLSAMIKAGSEGVKALGKADVGDKTMVDALAPAAAALEASGAADITGAAGLLYEAAEAGAIKTKDMKASKGRGRYQGEKSIGPQDAGAASVSIIFKALYDICRRYS